MLDKTRGLLEQWGEELWSEHQKISKNHRHARDQRGIPTLVKAFKSHKSSVHSSQ